jgi:hypothetical protein
LTPEPGAFRDVNVRASAAKARAVSAFLYGSPTRLRLQAPARPPAASRDLIESFGSNVRSIGPDNGAAIDVGTLEKGRVFQGLEHRAVEPRLEIDCVLSSITEDDQHAVIASVFRFDDAG